MTAIPELRRIAQLARSRDRHRAAAERAHREIVELVRKASAKGVTMREVGRAAGLSFQRVQQILDGIAARRT